MTDCAVTNMLQIAGIYKNETKRMLEEFLILPISEVDGVMGVKTLSRHLHLLTGGALRAINALEKAAIEYQNSASQMDFFVKQNYNMVRYKLYTSTNRVQWRDFIWANHVMGWFFSIKQSHQFSENEFLIWSAEIRNPSIIL